MHNLNTMKNPEALSGNNFNLSENTGGNMTSLTALSTVNNLAAGVVSDNNGPAPASKYQQLGLSKAAFKAFVAAPENRPTRNQHGTKMPGNVTLEHFMIWAVLRGKDPARCSHDPSGERYLCAIAYLTQLFSWQRTRDVEDLSRVLKVLFADALTLSDAKAAWRSYQESVAQR